MSFTRLTADVSETLQPGRLYIVANEARDAVGELTGAPDLSAPWAIVLEAPVEEGDVRIRCEAIESGDARSAGDAIELYDFECEEESQPAGFCSGSGADPVWILL